MFNCDLLSRSNDDIPVQNEPIISQLSVDDVIHDGSSHKEPLTTEPYIVNHEFPEKEQTVTPNLDWFDPFTNTPWANKDGMYYTIMDNDTEDDEDAEDNGTNSKAISSADSHVYNRNFISSIITIILLCLIL